jgi:surfeit locus 1 family protein
MTAVSRRPARTLHPVEWRELLRLRWILTTLLVLAAAAVLVRLGTWQLDRLNQRRAANAQLEYGMSLPPLNLNQEIPANLPSMEFRSALVSGVYDTAQQVLLRNQAIDGQAGYHLLTPLLIDGSQQAILVDRGFVTLAEGTGEAVQRFAEPGQITVRGQLMRSQLEPRVGGVPDPELKPGQTRLDAWNFINLERIGAQISRPLLTVYLLAAPDPALSNSPRRVLPEVDLSEGPHLGYALQWFIFALILLTGYPFYVRKQLSSRPTRS